MAGEEEEGIAGEFVDVNTEILHDGGGDLSDLQTVGAEAIGCFRAPMFADIDRAAQAELGAVLKLRVENAGTNHECSRSARKRGAEEEGDTKGADASALGP